MESYTTHARPALVRSGATISLYIYLRDGFVFRKTCSIFAGI